MPVFSARREAKLLTLCQQPFRVWEAPKESKAARQKFFFWPVQLQLFVVVLFTCRTNDFFPLGGDECQNWAVWVLSAVYCGLQAPACPRAMAAAGASAQLWCFGARTALLSSCSCSRKMCWVWTQKINQEDAALLLFACCGYKFYSLASAEESALLNLSYI